jgi:hypothetical protein
VLLRIAAHLIVAILLTAPLAAQPLSRSVLLLDQSSVGLPFNTALATAARLTLNAASKVPISFYAENLDANRFFGSDYEQEILSFFRQKYRNKTIDVVVAVGSAVDDPTQRLRPAIPRDPSARVFLMRANNLVPGASAIKKQLSCDVGISLRCSGPPTLVSFSFGVGNITHRRAG